MKNALLRVKTTIYPISFASVFWVLLLIPLFTSNLSVETVSERFNGRKQLIQIFNTFRLRMGDSVFPRVIIGEKQWIYLVAGETIQDYQKTSTWKTKELESLQKNLDKITADFQERGAVFLIVIAPNKSTIYPQYMPQEIKIIGDSSNLDVFLDYMKKHGKTKILDLRPALQEASQEEPVFFKTDSHWNYMGSYIAYRELIKSLSARYPQLQPVPLSSFSKQNIGEVVRDMPGTLGFLGVQENTIIISPASDAPIHTLDMPTVYSRRFRFSFNDSQQQSLKALIYHDSFFLPVVPLLETNFSQTISIQLDPRIQQLTPNIYWGLGWVDQQHPDILIYEVVERSLTRMGRLIDTWRETQSK